MTSDAELMQLRDLLKQRDDEISIPQTTCGIHVCSAITEGCHAVGCQALHDSEMYRSFLPLEGRSDYTVACVKCVTIFFTQLALMHLLYSAVCTHASVHAWIVQLSIFFPLGEQNNSL